MSTTPPLELSNVQGDILTGLPKKVETYWFIQIKDGHVDEFRTRLCELVPLITSSAKSATDRSECIKQKKEGKLLKLNGVNISFSKKGLVQMGITENLGGGPTDPFELGMLETAAANLNDRPEDTWLPEFRKEIHCLIFVTGDCQETVDETLTKIKQILAHTVKQIKLVEGKVRPGDQDAHEHFGYRDGVSQPAIQGVNTKLFPGQAEQGEPIKQGIILLKRDGDKHQESRPEWALDGSFLVFRYLSQLVPEFQEFIDAKNPAGAPKDFLGAKLVGRWKSGTPVVLAPMADNDPDLGKDPQRNNNFDYDEKSQDLCPYAAHTRKTNPRADLSQAGGTTSRRILRRGIPFGPELTNDEKYKKKTKCDRGLLFKCYQSNIDAGFQFIQNAWANNPTFPFLHKFPTPKPGFTEDEGPGLDALIGQDPKGGKREMDIIWGKEAAGKISLPREWVVAKGGEYFFSPSIPELKKKFALGFEKEEL